MWATHGVHGDEGKVLFLPGGHATMLFGEGKDVIARKVRWSKHGIDEGKLRKSVFGVDETGLFLKAADGKTRLTRVVEKQ
jgi:hypothetical protein